MRWRRHLFVMDLFYCLELVICLQQIRIGVNLSLLSNDVRHFRAHVSSPSRVTICICAQNDEALLEKRDELNTLRVRFRIESFFLYISSPSSFLAPGQPEILFPWAKVVRSTVKDPDLFSFALSIYFPSDLCIISSCPSIDINLTKVAISSVESGQADVVFDSPSPKLVVCRQEIARKFACYTDVTYSDKSSLDILYKLCLFHRFAPYVVLKSSSEPIDNSEPLPEMLTCDHGSREMNSDYVLLLPVFMRNNLLKSIANIKSQKWPSKIVVFQNDNKTAFDMSYAKMLSPVPVLHFWCTNWNSLFFMTYMSVMFMKEKYVVKMDDDCFLRSENAIREWYSYMANNPNTMIGVHGFALSEDHRNQIASLCGCDLTERKSDVEFVDHVAAIVMMYSWSGKIMHRFRTYAYVGAEDVAVSLANSYECGTRSVIHSQPYVHTGVADNKNHLSVPEIQSMYLKYPEVFMNTYCVFLRNGYNPVQYRKTKCTKNISNRF